MSFSISNLNPFGSKIKNAELSSPEIEMIKQPSSITSSEHQGVDGKPFFEWNVSRIYNHEEGCSKTKTWAVRILSSILIFPVLLTFIVDIGRKIGFEAGLLSGKSFSLIEQMGAGCKAIADKAGAAYKSFSTPLTITPEQLNQKSEQAIKNHAEKLINRYNALNGGSFHTNSSFSSPSALKAEKQIIRAQSDLIAEINVYVNRNATGTADFLSHLNRAEEMANSSIREAAQDAPYIENKMKRTGPRPFLRDVAQREFSVRLKDANQSVNAEKFIALAAQEPDFARSLSHGITTQIVTKEQAHKAVSDTAYTIFHEGLEKGLEEADSRFEGLLSSALTNKVVTDVEASLINESIQPTVQDLAAAAAIDVSSNQAPDTTEVELEHQLSKIAEKLVEKKKLKKENESQFLTEAKAQLAKAKDVIVEQSLKAEKEAQEIEAQKVIEVQKAANQQALLGKFTGLLALIGTKQEALADQFQKLNQLEGKRAEITAQLEAIRNTEVTIKGQKMPILLAQNEYLKAKALISSNSRLTSHQKNEQTKGLSEQGFTQHTIDKMHELLTLDPKHNQITQEIDLLSAEIHTQHEELGKLNSTYKLFRKHNLGGLEDSHRQTVESDALKVLKSQNILNRQHKNLNPGSHGLLSRVKSGLSKSSPVSADANRAEVEALLLAVEQSKALPSDDDVFSDVGDSVGSEDMAPSAPVDLAAPSAPAAEAPSLRSTLSEGFFNLGYKARGPYNYVASVVANRWKKKPQEKDPAAVLTTA